MDGVPALRILLTLDVTVAALGEFVEATGADGVQPYGARSAVTAAWAAATGLTVLRPVREAATSADAVSGVPEGQIPLIDSATGTRHGGTGIALDWGAMTPPDRPFILAGGLDPVNVAEAVAALHPWGVDASSGLESAPGIKDSARVAAFVEEAKRT
jgi:phosphoribosylanthranilate isomerase